MYKRTNFLLLTLIAFLATNLIIQSCQKDPSASTQLSSDYSKAVSDRNRFNRILQNYDSKMCCKRIE